MKRPFRKLSLNRLIINPFLIGLLITIVISIFFHDRFERFKLEKVGVVDVSPQNQHYFHDLDNDGLSEWIELGYNMDDEKFPYYSVFKDLKKDFRLIIGQYNIEKKWLDNSRVMFGDVDGDQQSEIIFLTYHEDSLFLFCGDPMDGVHHRFEIFLDTVKFRKESPDFIANIDAIGDLSNDGCEEILVNINAGLSLSPRGYYLYNFAKDTLIKKGLEYAHVSHAVIIKEGLQGPLVLPTRSYSPRNVSFKTDLTDSVSWLMLMDQKMDLVFSPIPNIGYKTNLKALFKYEDNEPYVYALFRDHDRETNPPVLKKYDTHGNLVLERVLNASGDNISTLFTVEDKKDRLIYALNTVDDWIAVINKDLTFGRKKKITVSSGFVQHDLDGDGIKEILDAWGSSEGQLEIYRVPIKDKVEAVVGANPGKIILSPIKSMDGFANIGIYARGQVLFYNYSRNPLFSWFYFLLAGIWILLSSFLYFLLLLQKRMLQKKYENERKLIELELMTIKNQVDPHFMFNTMNSIGSYILKEEKKKAYQYLIDFSNMIRSTLTRSREISVSLEEEMDFVKKYLELEQIRLNTSFDFYLDVEEDVNTSLQIPKMIIQTFAENAVKHGLRYKKERGRLDIKVFQRQEYLVIQVRDDGIGREGSRKLKTHSTGHGQDIVRQIISLFNRLNTTEVTFNIEDLSDEKGEAAGTLVTVKIPL